MTTPEATAEALSEAVKLASEFMQDFEVNCSCWNANRALKVAAERVLGPALQAVRDKERDAVVAWMRQRADNLPIPDDATSADVQRAGFAKEIITVFADAIAATQHRSTGHV